MLKHGSFFFLKMIITTDVRVITLLAYYFTSLKIKEIVFFGSRLKLRPLSQAFFLLPAFIASCLLAR